MFNVGPTQLMLVLVLALTVFGLERLPEIGRTPDGGDRGSAG